MRKANEIPLISKPPLKVALVQMQSQLNPQVNFEMACAYLEQSLEQYQAKLILFPENFLGMGIKDNSRYQEDFLAYIKHFCEMAKSSSVSLLLGSIPISAGNDNSKCFSRSFFVNSLGHISERYDKMHLFDVDVADEQGRYRESDSYQSGESTSIASFQINSSTTAYNLGLSICYDLRFPELYQVLRKQGAQMLAVPSAFTYQTGQAHWEILLRARAIENQCYVFGVNQCGQHPSETGGSPRRTWGHSMIISPWGEVLTSLGEQPGICSAEIDLDKLNEIRRQMPLSSHKRITNL